VYHRRSRLLRGVSGRPIAITLSTAPYTVSSRAGRRRSDLHEAAAAVVVDDHEVLSRVGENQRGAVGLTGMQVELPKALRLLAHELRAPLGILQGYLRILRDGRLDKAGEKDILAVMLKETGRLSTLARQASDLAAWRSGDVSRDEVELSAKSLIDRLAEGAPPLAIVSLPAEAEEWKVSSVHGNGLVEALTALAGLARRETPDSAVGVAVAAIEARPGSMTVAIGPAHSVSATLHSRDQHEGTLSLDSGGHGLALMVAAAVLDAHSASVSTTRDSVIVTFPLRGTV
jgi:signal transduction histidine kinase